MSLDAANGSISDSCDLLNHLELYAKDININHLKTELLNLPDLVQAYNDTLPVCTVNKVMGVHTLGKIINEVTSSKHLYTTVTN